MSREMSRVTQKGFFGYFLSKRLFSIFWMYIIKGFVCEKFSTIAVKISFLWGLKHSAYAAASSSANVTPWCSRSYTQIFTSVILYMRSYLSHSDCLMVILKFYTVSMFLHAVRNIVNQKAFWSKHVSIFYRNNDVISQ